MVRGSQSQAKEIKHAVSIEEPAVLAKKYSRFISNLGDMARTHRKKNKDYAGGHGTYYNFEYAAKLSDNFADPVDRVFASIIGIKLARLSVLLGQPTIEPLNESTLDTLRDLSTYCTIWWTYRQEREE